MTDAERRRRQLILALHRNGVPSSQIAKRLGVERREVNRVIRASEANG